VARWLVERRLVNVGDRLRSLRDELRVIDEQVEHLVGEADDARIRALVSETPMADAERREAERHAETMARHREEVAASIAELERRQDELLDQLTS
jgi:chromosome segregation ATPase